MVVNRQELWGVEIHNYGRRVYVLHGFLNREDASEYVSLLCRNIEGERTLYKGARR